ncbi:DsbE family thiol:disulfide interchange protein [Rubrivivax gelatinosus]|uniref:DsbE family thiol:disulfide interchange protein n=1 Tax=Rubrivivax gelatinosus TaxID=28068 RepID=A0ABS1DXM4_RUBGE|nr:DsbE family thiol:disulfide interchange protein [Rubrivivax gelatinosus]MBK1714831.1 DsbE family thiol:disulfide interchange protein [Rubrivivax gelatinosus]
MNRFLWPLVAFLVLVGFLAVGLNLNPREVPSPLIDKPAPEFRTTLLQEPERSVGKQDLVGQVWILNVWASWCTACREEHPVLVDWTKRASVPLYGLNYKDEAGAAKQWLQRLGDPYKASFVDRDGRIGIDFGVYGVPETFVVDKTGVIRYKHIGPVTPEVLRDTIEPLVRKLNG